MMRPLPWLVALLALWVSATGFSSPADFDRDAMEGGGAGYPFAGSQLSHGRTCSVCHVPAAPSPELIIGASDALLYEGYVPGRQYEIFIALEEVLTGGCSKERCNRNSFAATVVSSEGAPTAWAQKASLDSWVWWGKWNRQEVFLHFGGQNGSGG